MPAWNRYNVYLQNTDMGTYTFEKDAWHFALRPELGLILNGSRAGFNIVRNIITVLRQVTSGAGIFYNNVGFVFEIKNN